MGSTPIRRIISFLGWSKIISTRVGESMVQAIEEYKKKVLALSPTQSNQDIGEQTKYQKALELAERGVTYVKKRRADGRTFEVKSVRNINGFTFEEGSNSQSFNDTTNPDIKKPYLKLF